MATPGTTFIATKQQGTMNFLAFIYAATQRAPHSNCNSRSFKQPFFMHLSKTTVNKMLLVFPLGRPLRYQHRCPAPQLQPCVQAVSKRPYLRSLCLRTLTPPTHTNPPHSDLLCCHFQGCLHLCCHFQGCLHHQVPCHSASPLPTAHGLA